MRGATLISRLRSLSKCPTWFTWWGVFLVFVLVAFWAFGDVAAFRPLLYDDPEYLAGRPAGFGLAYWKELWTGAVANLWHPLTVLSHDLVVRFGGGSLWRHHLVNVLLHLGVVMAVVYWLRGMGGSVSGSLVVAFVWMLHPCLVESVAWVAGRKDILSALFILLSLGAAARGQPRWVVFVFGMGALLAKPVAVVLPAVLVVQDLAIRGKSLWEIAEWKGLFQRYAGLGLAAILLVILTLFFQGQGGQALVDPRGIMERLGGAGWALWRSFSLWFWPVGLHTAYDDPEVLSLGFAVLAIVLIGLGGWAMSSAKLGRAWRVGLALFLFLLLPTLGFVRAGNHLVADRYLYLPGLGLSLIFLGGLLKARPWALVLGIVLAFFLGSLSKVQRKNWLTTRTLFERVLELEPQHSYALAKLGNLERIEGRLGVARDYYQASLEQDEGSPDAHKNLAEMALEVQDYEKAYGHYRELVKRWGREVWLHEILAKLSYNLGELDQAVAHLQKGLVVARSDEEREQVKRLISEMQGR